MEYNPKIIGRRHEQDLIAEYCETPKAELVAIYGRRRVGKTYLVKQYFDNNFDFCFTGSFETPRSTQLTLFKKELERYSQKNLLKPKDWNEAFAQLREYISSLNKERIIVFLDELPWMDTPKSGFLSAFSYFWNNWASSVPGLKLFVCGSATTWMLSKFIGDKGGMHGRVNRQIYLRPFTLSETELFLQSKNIDLIETLNYLIGLNVETILYPKEGICTVEGVTRSGEHTLVIWRNVDMIDNEALNKFFEKQAYSTKDSEFDRIYVNGDCNLENLRTDEENWKVVLTEKEFAKRMFEDC